VNVLNIPNTLTMLRIVIIPVFVTAILYGRYIDALYLFAAAAVTDMLDGLCARITNQKTLLGTFLDPLADKFLLVTSFILFAVFGWIPKWFAIVVISRDLIVVIGWFLIYMVIHTSRVEPVPLGKLAIACELLLLAYILLSVAVPSVPAVPRVIFLFTAVITSASGLQYVYKGLRLTHAF